MKHTVKEVDTDSLIIQAVQESNFISQLKKEKLSEEDLYVFVGAKIMSIVSNLWTKDSIVKLPSAVSVMSHIRVIVKDIQNSYKEVK